MSTLSGEQAEALGKKLTGEESEELTIMFPLMSSMIGEKIVGPRIAD